MKDLKWRSDMSVEEKLEAGFKAVLGQLDAQEQEIIGLRQFMGQKLVEINGRFTKMDERFDTADARADSRFGQLETAIMMVSRQVRRMDETITTTGENVAVIKMDVKDLHERLDGLASTVDRHDSAIDEFQKVVGQK